MIYGIWNPSAAEHWYHLDAEVWWTEHKEVAEAQGQYVRVRFADLRWQACQIGPDGKPVDYQSPRDR